MRITPKMNKKKLNEVDRQQETKIKTEKALSWQSKK